MRDTRGSGKPFVLTLIYHMTHLPYSASHPHYLRYTDPDYRGDNRYRINFAIDEMIQKGFEHNLSEEDKQHIINLYDGCVYEFDAQVGAIVKELKELGLLDNTIVGVWADHGDDLYEHGTTPRTRRVPVRRRSGQPRAGGVRRAGYPTAAHRHDHAVDRSCADVALLVGHQGAARDVDRRGSQR